MNKYFEIGIEFDRELIHLKIDNIVKNKTKGCINTINSNIAISAHLNTEYKAILNSATINICDGSVMATCLSKIYSKNLKSYPGPDFFIDIISSKKYKHCFLGSTPEVLKNLKNKLISIDESIRYSLFIELPFASIEDFKYDKIAIPINNAHVDFIWVSLGAPKQEIFAYRLLPFLDKGVAVPVGAAFDFYGNKKSLRAPKWIIKLKLEWLYRLTQTPSKTSKRLYNEIKYMPKLIYKEYKNNR